MKPTNRAVNAIVMSLALSFVSIGALTTSVATASTVEQTSGSWVKKSKSIKGGWSIEKRGDEHVISFNEKFKTSGGPDLKVFLSPQTIDAVSGKTATDGAKLVAVLKSTKGTQEYVIPAGVDLSNFNSLLIHCEEFSVLWGGSDISVL